MSVYTIGAVQTPAGTSGVVSIGAVQSIPTPATVSHRNM